MMESKMEMLNLLHSADLEHFASNIEEELGISNVKQLLDPQVLSSKLKLIGMNECDIQKLDSTYKYKQFFIGSLKKTKSNKEHTFTDSNIYERPNFKMLQKDSFCNAIQNQEARYVNERILDNFTEIQQVYYDYPNKYDCGYEKQYSPSSILSIFKTDSIKNSEQALSKGKPAPFKNYLSQLVKKKKRKPNLLLNIPKIEAEEITDIKEMSEADIKELNQISNIAQGFLNGSLGEKTSPYSPSTPNHRKSGSFSKVDSPSSNQGNFFDFFHRNRTQSTSSKKFPNSSEEIFQSSSNDRNDEKKVFPKMKSTSSKMYLDFATETDKSSIQDSYFGIKDSPERQMSNPNRKIYRKKNQESKYFPYSNISAKVRNKSESELKSICKNPLLVKSKSADERFLIHSSSSYHMRHPSPEKLSVDPFETFELKNHKGVNDFCRSKTPPLLPPRGSNNHALTLPLKKKKVPTATLR